MKPKCLSICFSAALLLVSAVVARADSPSSPFDAVSSGSIVVYNVADLTGGQQDSADQLASLLRDTCEPDAWLGTWRAAALRATPRQLTIKASDNAHQEIEALLHQMREVQNRFVSLEYELVTADAGSRGKQEVTIADPLKAANFHVTKHIVSASQVTLKNGASETLVDEIATSLPTIVATATVSADGKSATLKIDVQDGSDVGSKKAKPVVFSMPLESSMGVQITTQSGVQWLILRAQAIERHWTPAGTTRLVAGN